MTLIEQLEKAEGGERVPIVDITPLYGETWHGMFARGDAPSRCERFELECPKPDSRGATAGLWFLLGHKGSNCLFVTALMIDPIAALKARENNDG